MSNEDTIREARDQSPPSEHDQLVHLVEVEIPALERERDRLQHIIDCANTPLMRDVLAERDALVGEVAALRAEVVTKNNALRECVRYFDSYGMPPAGFPLSLMREATTAQPAECPCCGLTHVKAKPIEETPGGGASSGGEN